AGWIYPLFAAFRALVGPDGRGELVWKCDPLEFWKLHGRELCARFETHMKDAGNDVKKVASNVICYAAMREMVKMSSKRS
ncbi:MAG TPA: hypothetical protein VGJ84_12830, partial [Polyangiaceae bacterium]